MSAAESSFYVDRIDGVLTVCVRSLMCDLDLNWEGAGLKTDAELLTFVDELLAEGIFGPDVAADLRRQAAEVLS